jgi:hypothetical protein
MDWPRRDAPTILLGVALLASAVLLFALGWNLTFFQDTWAFLLERRGSSVDDFLDPHNEHLVLIPVAVTKLSVALFGMTTARPEMVVMTLTLLVTAALLFIYVRRRVGPWLALMAAILLLFLGPAWMILLWPFEIEFSGAMMAGIGMLLMLDRDDRRGDVWACVLLVVAIGFGSLGIPFAAAALVDVFQKRKSRGWGRAYIAFVPLLLYLIWYAGWGHAAAHHMTLHNVLMSPQYLFDGFAASVDSLFGLNNIPAAGTGEPEWGRPLLIALIGAILYGQRRKSGFSPHLWPVLAAAATYWLLAAFNYIPGREAASNRYVYAGAAFLLLIGANLLQGTRFSRRALLIAGGVTFLALGPNLAQMRDGGEVLKAQTLLTRANTAALEIARRTIPPDFVLTPENSGTLAVSVITPSLYFDAIDAHGSSAYSPAELAAAPEGGRRWADVVLSKALPLSTATRPGASFPKDSSRCISLAGGAGAGTPEVQAGPGLISIHLAPGPDAALTARRFAINEYPVDLGPIPGGSVTLLRIPRDNAAQPWHLHVEASRRALVCR